jgi:hypothetical protein
MLNVKDIGGKGVGGSGDAELLQTALEMSKCVYVPEGVWEFDHLKYRDGNYIIGDGRATEFRPATCFMKGEDADVERRYYGGGERFFVYGPGKTATGSIGLDMRGCSNFSWRNIQVQNFERGVVQGGIASYYNDYDKFDQGSVGIGFDSGPLANENTVRVSRVVDCDIGTRDNGTSGNGYIRMPIETFTQYAHLITGAAAVGTSIRDSRIENPAGVAAAIYINANAQDTEVSGERIMGCEFGVVDLGIRTKRPGRHFYRIVEANFIPMGSGTGDLLIPFDGVEDGDGIFVTLDKNTPAGIAISPIPYVGPNYLYNRCLYVGSGIVDPGPLMVRVDVFKRDS